MTIIKLENVKKTFKENDETIEALKETSLSLKEGELVAIVGPSGSGKSTLLTIMGGLQRPTSGDLIFDGEDLSDMDEKDRNKLRFDKIGFILQSSNLIPYLTVYDQFRLVDKFAGRDFNEKRASELLEKMEIIKRKNLYPDDLSGGERQRAAIARALYTDPKLILADEPTASLDSKRAVEVVKLLKDLSKDKKRTTVMVTHDKRLLDYCDRAFEVVDGSVNELEDF